MTEREEEPHAECPSAIAEELAGRVVDGRDVVGVERVAESEAVGKDAEPGNHGMARGVERDQAPAGYVQARDRRPKSAQLSPLQRIERVRQAPQRTHAGSQ